MARKQARVMIPVVRVGASIQPSRDAIGSIGGPDPDRANVDFRQVPASDVGNEGYRDQGQLGSWAPSNREPFRSAPDVRFDYDGGYGEAVGGRCGYGCSEADADLGFIRPTVREPPAHDLVNYKDRYSAPREPDEDQTNTQSFQDDWEFRDRARRTRGLFTRPRVPTER